MDDIDVVATVSEVLEICRRIEERVKRWEPVAERAMAAAEQPFWRRQKAAKPPVAPGVKAAVDGA